VVVKSHLLLAPGLELIISPEEGLLNQKKSGLSPKKFWIWPTKFLKHLTDSY
jgi:hypothetical protein